MTGLVRGDFGQNREGQDVSTLLGQAISTTFRLVILATLLVDRARHRRRHHHRRSPVQHRRLLLDVPAFLFFSLPVFWVAVLLKEFGAIKFNDFLEAPGSLHPSGS